jgi:transcription antitermination protein NusB
MLDLSADELPEQLRRVFPPGPYLDRRLGRGLAFQALYEMDLAHHAPANVLQRAASTFRDAATPQYPSEVVDEATRYAEVLVNGVLTNRTPIDALIQQRAPLWPLAQMSAIDRNVLRLGLYESLYGNATVPLRTAINEAVELAKLFGSETSAKFVNGVLGRAVEASASGEGQPHAPDAGASATDTSHPATSAGPGERGFKKDDGRER